MNLDVLGIISLYLPYNFLTLSRELSKIYNELWFKDKILLKYPNCNNYNNSWIDLYKKSLKQGKIKDNNSVYFPIEGIKIASMFQDGNPMILTFCGDLWSYTNKNKIYLIDNNVTDINTMCYFKENKLYQIWGRYSDDKELVNFGKLLIEIKTKFIAISYLGNTICAITEDKLYCYNSFNNFIDVDCPNSVDISVTAGFSYFMIKYKDGSIKIYNSHINTFTGTSICNVTNIYNGSARLSDGSIISIKTNYCSTNRPLIIKTKSKLDNSDKLTGFHINRKKIVKLIDNKIYDDDDKLLEENVKNICEYGSGYYTVTY